MARIIDFFDRELKLVLLMMIASQSVISEEVIPVSVTRRLYGDAYRYLNSSDHHHEVCHDGNNLTYLVNERRCVKNQELFSGKIQA